MFLISPARYPFSDILNLPTGNLLLSFLTSPAGYLFLIQPARHPFSDIVYVWAGRAGESVAGT